MCRTAIVVVLGDLARSPRMLNHAHALRGEGFRVHLVGDANTPLPSALLEDPGVRLHALPPAGSRRAGVLAAAGRVRARRGVLAHVLERIDPPATVLLAQLPPGLPTLAPVLATGRRLRAPVILDWHNFGWDVAALRGGVARRLAPVLRRRELALAHGAQRHLAVSDPLAAALDGHGIPGAHPLPDAANRWLHWPRSDGGGDPPTLVCPMSWSDDDDLELLAHALRRLSDPPPASRPAARLLLTGTGPRARDWQPRLTALSTPQLTITTEFVPADGYPAALAGAALGLSLHRSASGVDYPMKIVEMRRVGLPVLALRSGPDALSGFRAPGDGRTFTSASELADLLEAFLLRPEAAEARAKLRSSCLAPDRDDWLDRWRAALADILTGQARDT